MALGRSCLIVNFDVAFQLSCDQKFLVAVNEQRLGGVWCLGQKHGRMHVVTIVEEG
jgi:hypothetical protein